MVQYGTSIYHQVGYTPIFFSLRLVGNIQLVSFEIRNVGSIIELVKNSLPGTPPAPISHVMNSQYFSPSIHGRGNIYINNYIFYFYLNYCRGWKLGKGREWLGAFGEPMVALSPYPLIAQYSSVSFFGLEGVQVSLLPYCRLVS